MNSSGGPDAGGVLRRLAARTDADAHDEPMVDRVTDWLVKQLRRDCQGLMETHGGARVIADFLTSDGSEVVKAALVRLVGEVGALHLDLLVQANYHGLWDHLLQFLHETPHERLQASAWRALASIGPKTISGTAAVSASLPSLISSAWDSLSHVNVEVAAHALNFVVASAQPGLSSADFLGKLDTSFTETLAPSLAVLHGTVRAGHLDPDTIVTYLWRVHALLQDPTISAADAMDVLGACLSRPGVFDRLGTTQTDAISKLIDPLFRSFQLVRGVELAALALKHAPADAAAVLSSSLNAVTAQPVREADKWGAPIHACLEQVSTDRQRSDISGRVIFTCYTAMLNNVSTAPHLTHIPVLAILPWLIETNARRNVLVAAKVAAAGLGDASDPEATARTLIRLMNDSPLDDRCFLALATALATRADNDAQFAALIARHLATVERLLCDARWEIRDTALSLVGSLANAEQSLPGELWETVISRARDDEAYVRRQTLLVLRSQASHQPTLLALARQIACEDSEALVRRAAVDLLAVCPTPPSDLSSLWVQLLQDADWETRSKVAGWIAAFADKSAVDVGKVDQALAQAQAAPERAVRVAAHQARVAIGSVSSEEHVAELEEESEGVEIDRLFDEVHACDNVLDCY